MPPPFLLKSQTFPTLFLIFVYFISITDYRETFQSFINVDLYRANNSKPRLLISIATFLTSTNSQEVLRYLFNSISEMRCQYKNTFEVVLFVDTNSNFLASPLYNFTTQVLLCNNSEMAHQLNFSMREWTSDEIGHFHEITGVHRYVMEQEANVFDFFLYMEDDIFVPLQALEYFVKTREDLWRFGWLPGFVRIEHLNDYLSTEVATDIREIITDPILYQSQSWFWAHAPAPYCAAFMIDRSQLLQFIADPSNTWRKGALNFNWPSSFREKMAVGWYYALVPHKGWLSRALVPIAENGELYRVSFIFHQSNKYGKSALLWSPSLHVAPSSKFLIPPNLLYSVHSSIKSPLVDFELNG